MMDLFSLSGKVAVVTGGSGAIGGGLALGMARAGADLVLCCNRHRDNAEALKKSIEEEGLGVRVEVSQLDSLDAEAVSAHAAWVREQFGHVDILLNTAGGNVAAAITGKGRTFFDLEMSALLDVVHLNLFGGCIYPCMFYGREMVKNGEQGGSIINITSMNYYRPLEGRPGYSASKAAVANFTQWLATHVALECNPHVRVNAIAPGFVPNARTIRSLVNEDGTFAPRGQRIIDHTPMKRLSTPEDMVGTCIWYASDASRYVTGTVTPVDGGFTAYAGV